MAQRSDYSVLQFIKSMIGKDVTTVSMPIIFNEPLSFLQRFCEYFDNWQILKKANECSDRLERMQYVAAFAVSTTVANSGRLYKPFNPLLGETYELRRKSVGFHYIAEQVSHHPPVSAVFCEVPGLFRFSGSVGPKIKLSGQVCEMQPRGIITLELLKHGDVYTWQNVSAHVHNILVGKMWLELLGELDIVNHTKDCSAKVTYKRAKLFNRKPFRVEGAIYDGTGDSRTKVKVFYGDWTEAVFSVPVAAWDEYKRGRKRQKKGLPMPATTSFQLNLLPLVTDVDSGNSHSCEALESCGETTIKCDRNIPGQLMVIRAKKRPPNSKDYYGFSFLSMLLNELSPEDKALNLPPTDSRFRSDVKAYEAGDVEKGSNEKLRLEEKQRAARRRKEKNGEVPQSPLWFKQQKHEYLDKDTWVFNSEYLDRDWSRCADIF